MTAHRQVVSNFLALGTGETLSRLIAFSVAIYLARILGAESYGIIALAVGMSLYLGKVADFGIETAGIKEVAGAPDDIVRLASALMSARLAMAAVLVAAAASLSLLLLAEPERTVFALYSLSLLLVAASTKWIHIGLEGALPVALARVAGDTLILALVLAFVHSAGDLTSVPIAQLAGEFVVVLLLYLQLVTRGVHFRLRWDLRAALPVFARSFPLLVQLLLGLMLYNADLVFLRALRDAASVGYYAAAYALISLVANIGMTYAFTLLPVMSRTDARSHDETALWSTALAQTVAVSLPVAAGIFMVAPQIIHLGFGDGYAPSAAALRVLAFSIPFFTIRNVPWVAMIARGRVQRLTGAMVWAVAVNLVLNVLLVPPLGTVGAGLATVVAEFVCASLMLRETHREHLPLPEISRLARPFVSVVVMVGVLWLIGTATLVSGVGIGVLAFTGTLTALGGIRWKSGQLPTLNV
jgi:O-antigen/teichoic acid export membrane protein